MIIRKTVLSISLLLFVFTCIYAKQDSDSSSRFGHGKDSIECLRNIGRSYALVNKGKYKKAYTIWRKVITNYPCSQVMLYSNGREILCALIQAEKNTHKKASYVNELCNLYDLNLTHLTELNKMQLRPMTADVIYTLKAHDYLTYAGECLQSDTAYLYVQQAVQACNSNLQPQLLEDWMKVIHIKYQQDPSFIQTYLHDYDQILAYIQAAYQTSDIEQKKIWEQTLKTVQELYQEIPKS